MIKNPLNKNKPLEKEVAGRSQNQSHPNEDFSTEQKPNEIEVHQKAIEELKVELEERERNFQEMQTAKETEAPKKSTPTDDQTDKSQKTVSAQTPTTGSDQVNQLMQIALTKGLNEAISQAKKTNDPYLIDELHDVLVRELYQRLLEQKK
ncbi:MAG: hypothetical protein ACD_68C00026G0005 [uncultured bacterium]|nr:MAG: hypothetical protein ACD_68C00026G0005 [uncultured bacterium]